MRQMRKMERDKTGFAAGAALDKTQALEEATFRIPSEGVSAQTEPLRGHPQAVGCKWPGIFPQNNHLASRSTESLGT